MKSIFEVSTYRGDPVVICNDYDNLELQIIFHGTQLECEDLVERLDEAQARGMFKTSLAVGN